LKITRRTAQHRFNQLTDRNNELNLLIRNYFIESINWIRKTINWTIYDTNTWNGKRL